MRKPTILTPNTYLFRFAEALGKQLEMDQERYGDTWRSVPPGELADEIYNHLERYWVEYSRDKMPIPWLKVAGLALIGWVRSTHPSTYVDPD